MTGKMYKFKPKFAGADDDFLCVETLNNVVCLQNCRTNRVVWVTKNVLSVEYVEKGTK
jgi:hypothetical protein